MSDAKRRDNKGRVLHVGEAQMEDGRYMYRYKDPYGKRKTVYSMHSARSLTSGISDGGR